MNTSPSSQIADPAKINVSIVALKLARVLDRLPAGKHTITFVKSSINAEAWRVQIVGYDDHGQAIPQQQHALTKSYSPE